MSKSFFVEILLPLALEKTYTYSIPEELIDKIEPGYRVIVVFGKRKLYTGIVVEVHSRIPDYETKAILSVSDDFPIVSKEQMKLINWVSSYYCCTSGEVMNAAIPSKLIPSGETKVFFNNNCELEIIPSKSEQKILDFLLNTNSSDIDAISKATEIKNPIKQLENLESAGIISLNQNITDFYKPIFQNNISFSLDSLQNNAEECNKILSKEGKQKEIIVFLTEKCNEIGARDILVPEKSVVSYLGVSKSSIDSLTKKGIICNVKVEVSRFIGETISVNNTFQLTANQLDAYNQIIEIFNTKKPVLLHGVTSSGKTEIYIKLIERALSQGRQVMYLLPEIALTTQIIERLKNYFGDQIGIFHSKYSLSARSEVYRNVLQQKLKVVLGVRSAVFLPFSNLGLIIVDEEHETSFKQNDPDPRYNARDLALVLSKIHNANIVLGSATPSVESYHNSKIGKYGLVELNMRYGNVMMPEIIVADIKDAYRRRIMQSHFHPILVEETKRALTNSEQIILFQNRRGYSPNVECKECGWVRHCKNCNVSMTYHKWENKLVCHYCGEKSEVDKKCPVCKSENLKSVGLGTERIEDEAMELFPGVRIARLDLDTAGSRKKFEKILNGFAKHEFDILIGTQMVTKGLDFEKVGLVGILNADNMLNFPDFRAFERAFQLMTQVSGRAGRRDKRGKVIIQTFSPEHPIINFVLSNDYAGMYNSQISEREVFKYPPFWNFIVIRLKNKDKSRLYRGAAILANSLKSELFGRVKGPEEPLINRISNNYILNIHIRFEKTISAAKIKESILYKIKQLKTESEFGSIIAEIDVDPI